MENQCPVELEGEVVSNHDELMSNFFAQPDALAYGKSKEQLSDEVRCLSRSYSLSRKWRRNVSDIWYYLERIRACLNISMDTRNFLEIGHR